MSEELKNVPINADLHKQLKTRAAMEGKSIKDILEVLIKEYLKEKRGKK
jgi:plasmid stability protein